MQTQILGLIGSGVMGRTVAARWLRAGYSLFVFDVSLEAQEKVRALGATVAANLRNVAERADVMIMFLPGPTQVRTCVAGPEGLLSAARRGSVIVDMSTVDPGTSRDMWHLAKQAGVGYLDAPVLGRPATVGKWTLPIGGMQEDIERCAPVFDLIAAKCIPIGGPGSGNKIKLLNQLMFSAINAMTAEMMAVSEKVGIAPKLLYETITASQAGTVSNLFKELGQKIVAEDFEDPTFSVDLLCKDVRLAVEMAQEAKAPPLLARTIQFVNEMAQSQGFGASDTAIMWKSFSRIWESNDCGAAVNRTVK
jgi:3-hydroxyisobutyrate dehydrogenase/2-hydroxy-3-oxopropionate reductase